VNPRVIWRADVSVLSVSDFAVRKSLNLPRLRRVSFLPGFSEARLIWNSCWRHSALLIARLSRERSFLTRMYPLTRHNWRFSLNCWHQTDNFPKFIVSARGHSKWKKNWTGRDAKVKVDRRTSRALLLLNPDDCWLFVSVATPVHFTVVPFAAQLPVIPSVYIVRHQSAASSHLLVARVTVT